MSGYIIYQHTTTFGNTEYGIFWHLQDIDNQRLYFYKILSSSTGKEKDSETGFYYFGARYYDPTLSGLFISVDPMADKYPTLSPYAYCAWNPVKLVDPQGTTWETTKDKEMAKRLKEDVQNRISNLEIEKQLLENEKRDAKSEDAISNINYLLSETTNQIDILNDFVAGINELSDSDIRYTFNPTRSKFNKVKTFASPGLLYEIKYQSGNEGNKVHETMHAIQVDRMEHHRIDRLSPMEMEQGAYSTQFSFSQESMPNSKCSTVPNSRISADWIRKIYYNDNGEQFPYKNL